jgi:signal peptidase II
LTTAEVEAEPATGASHGRRNAYLRAAAVLAVVVGLDQLTKALRFAGWPRVGHPDKLMPGLSLVRVENPGVAFGFLGGGGVLVYILTGLALIALVVFFVRTPERPWVWLPTGMLLGGAIGNLLDRIRLGAVRDFIKLPHWPAFNVADMAITFGVVILLFVVEAGRSERR